jgi:hypothetical protein
MNRCLNHIFGYCTGEPKRCWAEAGELAFDYEGQTHYQPLRVLRCHRDYHTCGKYLTQTELCTLTIK